MDRMAGKLVTMVEEAAKEACVGVRSNRVGSMFTWFFNNEQVTDWTSASKSDTAAFGRFHRAMLNAGVYLPPSQFEAAFLSAAHTDQDVSETVAAAREAFSLARV
jgi:glutamate-1-semialdehyde 2,1-aminomutase